MLNNTTEIVFHKVDNLPEKNLSNYIGHIFFTSNGGIYMCKRVEGDTFEWRPFGAVVDPDIIPTYEEILAIAQGKADDVTAEFNGKFGEISKFEDEVSITVGDLKKGLEDLNDSYTGFVTEFAVESENIRGRLTGVENGQVAVQTLLSLGLDESVLRMEGLVNGVVEKSAQIETTVDSIRTQVENISGMSSQFEQLDDKIEASVNNATANIDSRLRIAEGRIEATVSSDTFETRMSQLPGEISQTVEDRTADMRSAIAQLPEQIQLTVENETTSAAIIAKINNDKSEVKIEADKINIEGTLTVGRGIGEDTEGHDFFRVNDGGSIEARNATIYGAINAEEGHIGGLNIDSDGSLYVKEGTRDIYRLGADGKLTANNAVLTGKITADEGYIGNVEIKDGGLRNGENFRLSSDGSLTVKNASVEGTIEAREGHIGELNIDTDGSLYVKNNSNSDVYRLGADGKLTAKNVDLTGTINATAGKIGNISIENGAIYSENRNFSISSSGDLSAVNANITGTINASAGSIGNAYKLIVDNSGIYSINKYQEKNYLIGAPEEGTASGTTIMTGVFRSPACIYEGNAISLDDPATPEHGYYTSGYLPQAIKYNDIISSVNGDGQLPSGMDYIGRRIWIGNCDPDSMSTLGGGFDLSTDLTIEGNPSTGDPLFFFYENGRKTSKLHLENEYVELLGYGAYADNTGFGSVYKFRGYIVLNRGNVNTGKTYGHMSRTLAYAKVSSGSLSKARVFNGKDSDIVTKYNGGVFSITFNTLKVNADRIHVTLTPTSNCPYVLTADVTVSSNVPTITIKAWNNGSQVTSFTSSKAMSFTMSVHNMDDFWSFEKQQFYN